MAPGDVILANAGWVYPILDTYWPQELAGAGDALPPPLPAPVRIIDYTQTALSESDSLPFLVRSGSVDGAASLGWGSPASDFFAVSTAATEEALAALAQRHPRLWHYRLYDTVSDPQGVIRAWLDQHATLVQEQTIPGRDFGALQLFALQPLTAEPPEYSTAPDNALPDDVAFDGTLTLLSHTAPVSVSAGSYLYTDLFWQIDQNTAHPPANLSLSLRLYDSSGQLAAQRDGPALPPGAPLQTATVVRQPLALPVAADTQPGNYALELVVYRATPARRSACRKDRACEKGNGGNWGSWKWLRIKPRFAVGPLFAPMQR